MLLNLQTIRNVWSKKQKCFFSHQLSCEQDQLTSYPAIEPLLDVYYVAYQILFCVFIYNHI